jgi:hypothetical protein
MSLALYSTALLWRGHSGVAKLYGRQVALTQPPALAGLHIKTIDYRPEIGERRLQTCDGQVREMELAEVAAADEFLRRVVSPN